MNTMRDTLIKLIDAEIDCSKTGIVSEWIADYLIENGVIVPSCKVGDMVYDKECNPYKVKSIEWYSKKVMHLHCEGRTFSVGKRSVGKTVFLTKEEAEKALKEGVDNG